jgi:cysteine desulfurase/selenocysteine lyase
VAALTVSRLDVETIRKDFPLLARSVHGKPLVYLDSAATALQPRSDPVPGHHHLAPSGGGL